MRTGRHTLAGAWEGTIVTCNTINKLSPRYATTTYLGPLLKIVYCAKWVVFSNSVTCGQRTALTSVLGNEKIRKLSSHRSMLKSIKHQILLCE